MAVLYQERKRRAKTRSIKKRRKLIDDQKIGFKIMRSPASQVFKTTLRYATTFSLDPGIAGIPGVHTFRANSLFDPDVTGGGHQPRGFDQLIQLWDHFVVSNAKITVWFSGQTNETVNYIAGITLQDDGTVSLDYRDYLERGYTNNQMIGVGVGSKPAKMVMYSDTAKFLGRKGILTDNQLKGGAGANPAESLIFHVFATSANLSNTGALSCYCTIDYNVYFIEPKDVSIS